jgi:hypothetical protein
MIKDFVLCARAVEQNKLLVELEPSFSLLAPRNIFSPSEHPNWLLTHLHNHNPTGEPFQNQRRIDFDSPDVGTVTSQQNKTRLLARNTRLHTAAFALLTNALQSIVSPA